MVLKDSSNRSTRGVFEKIMGCLHIKQRDTMRRIIFKKIAFGEEVVVEI